MRVRERLIIKETKETIEIMETSDMQIQNCMERKRLGRLWRPVEIHEYNVYGGTEGLERL